MKDLTHIDGVEVISRQKAVVAADDSAVGNLPGVFPGQVMKTVDEVLLIDERTVYQCTHHADDDCTYSAPSVRSVTAHQRVHGGKAVAKRAQATIDAALAEAAQAKAELEARKQRRSEGSKQGAITRKNNLVAAPPEIGGKNTTSQSGNANVVGNEDLAKAAQNVIVAFNAMQTCADEFQRVLIGYMRMAQTASEAPSIDPQILAKAHQYDAMKAAMKAMNDL
jgi:hypothetical protein